MAVPRPSLGRLILVPALITLAITLIRLVGELSQWSPSLFNREPGGPGALVGIVWLIPVFGIYFALRLVRAGDAPSGIGTALLPQLSAWIYRTVVAGMFFGALAVGIRRLVRRGPADVAGASVSRA